MAQPGRPRGTRRSAVEANKEPRQAKLRQTMMQAARFPPEQGNICMKHIKRKFKERVVEGGKEGCQESV
jgi:hypothetical protein